MGASGLEPALGTGPAAAEPALGAEPAVVEPPARTEPAPVAPPGGVERLLAAARAEIDRLTPAEALAASAAGAVLVDIRPSEQRRREGELPGAHIVDRNVLEWRLDPGSRYRDRELAHPGLRVILVCREGYQSSLAAATLRRFGVDAADVVGGTVEWRRAGLPVL